MALQELIAQLRGKYGPSWEGVVGLPMPPMQPQQGGMGQGGPRLASEFNDMARTGVADPTLGNIGRAAAFGGGLMSGTGPIGLGMDLGLHAAGLTGNPMPSFTGQSPVLNPNIRQGTLEQMRQQLSAAQRDAYNKGKIAEMGRRMGASARGAHGRGGFGGTGGGMGGSSRGKRGE